MHINNRCTILTTYLGEVENVVAQHRQHNQLPASASRSGMYIDSKYTILTIYLAEVEDVIQHRQCSQVPASAHSGMYIDNRFTVLMAYLGEVEDIIAQHHQHNQLPALASRSGTYIDGKYIILTTYLGEVEDIVQHHQHHQVPASACSGMYIDNRFTVLTVYLGGVEDVVAQHHQRNCAPCLPSNSHLLAICDEQSMQCSCSRNASHCRPSVNQADELSALISAALQPAAMTSTKSSAVVPGSAGDPGSAGVPSKQFEHANPTQLHFYPPTIHNVIEWAKQISHCKLGCINSFPLCPHFNSKATDYFNEALAEQRTQGLSFPTGRSHH